MRNKSAKIVRLCRVSVFVALICICSWIQIPLGQIPFTMQLFGIYLALFTLGGIEGSLAVAVYLAIGAVGLPVFSSFSGGIGRLVDATGGFLQGFLLLALAFAALEALLGGGRVARVISSLIPLALTYLWGAGYYAVIFLGGISELWAALAVTVLPHLIPDLLKLALASFVARRVRRALGWG